MNNQIEKIELDENLTAVLVSLKSAQNNKISDYQIDETLRSDTRISYRYQNPFFLITVSFIIYFISFYSVIANAIVLYILFKYILLHPSFSLLKLWFKEGATKNQIDVIYYQIFNHTFLLRYTLIIPVVTISLSCYSYAVLGNSFGINLIFFKSVISSYSDINIYVSRILENMNNNEVKDLLRYSLMYSEVRAVPALLNFIAVFFLTLISMVQVIRRPKNV